MEKVKLPVLKFILNQWSPDSEIPFRKAKVLEAIKNIPDLEELIDNRDWSDIEEEMSEEKLRMEVEQLEQSEKIKEERRQRKAEEMQELKDLMNRMEGCYDRKLSEVEEQMKVELTATNKRLERLEREFEAGKGNSIVHEINSTLKSGAMPTFDGKGSLEVFLQQIALAAKLGNWSTPVTAGNLVMQLRGTASLVVKGLSVEELTDLNKIQSRLRQRFSEFKGGEISRIQFHSCTQGRKESIREFAQRLEGMSFHAYADIDEKLRSSMIRTQFIAGLADPEVKMKMSTAETVLSLPDTVSRAELLNEIFMGSNHRVLAMKQDDVIERSTDVSQVDNLKRNQERMNSTRSKNDFCPGSTNSKTNFSPTWYGKDGILCYYCHQRGHIARNCAELNGSRGRRNVRWFNPIGNGPSKPFNRGYRSVECSFSDSENYRPARMGEAPGKGNN